MVISESDGRQIGRKERLLGAMGVMRMLLMPFCMMGPPAEREYAVDPVGVEISIPSPAVSVIFSLLIKISSIILSASCLVMHTSLMHVLPIFSTSSPSGEYLYCSALILIISVEVKGNSSVELCALRL